MTSWGSLRWIYIQIFCWWEELTATHMFSEGTHSTTMAPAHSSQHTPCKSTVDSHHVEHFPLGNLRRSGVVDLSGFLFYFSELLLSSVRLPLVPSTALLVSTFSSGIACSFWQFSCSSWTLFSSWIGSRNFPSLFLQSIPSSLLSDVSTCWTLAFEGLSSALGSKQTRLKCSKMDSILIKVKRKLFIVVLKVHLNLN